MPLKLIQSNNCTLIDMNGVDEILETPLSMRHYYSAAPQTTASKMIIKLNKPVSIKTEHWKWIWHVVQGWWDYIRFGLVKLIDWQLFTSRSQRVLVKNTLSYLLHRVVSSHPCSWPSTMRTADPHSLTVTLSCSPMIQSPVVFRPLTAQQPISWWVYWVVWHLPGN